MPPQRPESTTHGPPPPPPAPPPPRDPPRPGPRELRGRHRHADALVFAPAAWAKLMFFLHAGRTEVGGFGISSAGDPLYVEQFRTVRQRASSVTVAFDDAAVAEHFDACVDAGLTPDRFARIWVHTHPGDSAEPSMTDERTFARVFGRCDWALMFIASRGGNAYARLSFAAGPGAAVHLPVAVDWASWPGAVLDAHERWEQELADWAREFEANVHPAVSPADRAAPMAAAGMEDPLYDAMIEERLEGWRFDPWSDDVLDLRDRLTDWPESAVWA